MAVYYVSIYASDPRAILSRSTGDFSTWTGAGSTSGTATITDSGTSPEDLSLTDGNRSESATADVSVDGYSATGVSVEAEDYWLLRDTITGETITVVRFNVDGGAQQYTLTSQPLVQGRVYETLDYDNSPETSQGTGFAYADFNDGTVQGTDGDDVIDRDYTGDPNGDRVDNNDLYTSQTSQEQFTWSTFGDNANMAGGATQTNGDVQVTISSSLPAGSTFIANYDDNNTGTIEDGYSPPGSGFSSTSVGRFFANGNATNTTLTVDFDSIAAGTSTEVHNVQFVISDIDGVVNAANNFQDILTITAFDADGNPVEVTIEILGNDTLSADGQTVIGSIVSDQSNSVNGAVLVTIAGPVERFFVEYDNGGDTQQAIYFSDIRYDAVSTQGNADSIDAGAGNDSVFAGSDNDTVLGGTGNDTIDGGSGNDSLQGDAGNDSLIGGSGNDTLSGGLNDDILDGGSGSDSLLGDDGNDTLDGGIGDDILRGGAGDDVLTGSVGNDTLQGDGGADNIAFTGGAGQLDGGSGNDTIRAEGTSNLVTGGAGADLISGGSGTETVDGGTGNDTIQTSGNADVLSGGDGADLFDVADGFGADTLTGGEGGTDFDVVDFSDLTSAVNVTFSGPEAGTATDGTDTLAFSQIERFILTDFDDSVTGNTGNEDIIAGAGNDTIDGNGGNDIISGGAGDDSISFGTGSDTIDGGADADLIFGLASTSSQLIAGGEGGDDRDTLSWENEADAADAALIVFSGDEAGTGTLAGNTVTFSQIETVHTTQANDTIDASATTGGVDVASFAGNDIFTGGTGADTFSGGSGDDTIDGGAGADQLSGGDDADTFVVTGTFGNDTIDGGEGGNDVDTIDLSGLSGPVTVTYTGDEAGTITDGSSTITFSNVERLILTDFDDVVNGALDGAGLDIDARDGNDTIVGGSGRDSIIAGDGDDSVFGGDGVDTIEGGAGNDTLDGGDRTDFISGGDGDDSIRDTGGGLSDDTITGGAGNDTIAGGQREDLMDGGDDQDLFLIEDNFGDDTIIGGEGGVDFDTIDLSALSGPVTVVYTGDEEGTITDGVSTITFSGIENLILTEFDDSVDGSAAPSGIVMDGLGGNDTVLGGDANAANDVIDGGAGDDSIEGLRGEDTLLGGDGNDTIDGGDQGDIIDGGAGDDVIEAGEEVNIGDSDSVRGGDGNDTITSAETDVGSNDSLFGDAGDDSISASGGGTNLLSGGTGNDTLQSGTGADSLEGNEDEDLFIVTGAIDNDTILGGEGGSDTDTVDLSGVTNPVNVTHSGDEAGSVTDGGDTLLFSEIEQFTLTGGADTLDGSLDTAGMTIDAGAGDDTLLGGSGNDEILGGTGADTIDGGAGDDLLSGGDDSDTFILSGTFGNDTIIGGEGGTDEDTIDLSALTGPVTVTYTGDEAGTITDGVNTINFSNIENLILTGFDDVVDASLDGAGINIVAGGGDDSIIGGSGADSIDGGAGNDSLIGGAGGDTLAGGAGNDELLVGTGDSGTGGDGDDFFLLDPANIGGGGITLVGGEGDETNGDTLDFNDLSDPAMIDISGADRSGNATLDDGTTVDFAEMEAVICFAAGTRIATPRGLRRVDELSAGDLVLTRDAGPQPLHWVGLRRGLTSADMAPIRFDAGSIGNNAPLRVSPNHRMLVRGWRAQLMFGEEEVLVPAKSLVDGVAVHAECPGAISYFHLLTPEHEIIFAEGAEAETFLPALEGLDGVDAIARARLFRARPELRADLAAYGRTARPTMRMRVGQLLAG